MVIDELFFAEKIVSGGERDLESGDNPAERKRKQNAETEEDKEGDRDLESGDNPAERRRRS